MTKEITIHAQTFTLSTPYAEGHTLTENEAKALNQVRAENIANNFRGKVKTALDGENVEADMDALRVAMAEYDESYVFHAPRAAAATMSPLEKECNKQARAWLAQKLKGTEFKTIKAYTEAKGKDFVDAKVAEIAEVDGIVKLAKAALKEAEKLADSAIGVELAD